MPTVRGRLSVTMLQWSFVSSQRLHIGALVTTFPLPVSAVTELRRISAMSKVIKVGHSAPFKRTWVTSAELSQVSSNAVVFNGSAHSTMGLVLSSVITGSSHRAYSRSPAGTDASSASRTNAMVAASRSHKVTLHVFPPSRSAERTSSWTVA